MAGVESAVRLHIDRGDDLDARDDRGQTPLMIAASRNKASVCQVLLDAGVDVGALGPCGRDALSIAISAGADDAAATIEAFLGTPARPNGADQFAAAPMFGDPVAGNHYEPPIPAFFPVGDGPKPEHEDLGRTGDPEAEPPESAAAAGQSHTDSSFDITLTSQSEGVSRIPRVRDFTDDSFVDEAPFDAYRWVPEEHRPAPDNDASLADAANAVQISISNHTPIDRSAAWDDFDLFLPARAASPARHDDPEARAELRLLLLRAIREGSVPDAAVDGITQGGNDPDEAASALRLVINDLGAETDERFEYALPHESFEVAVDASESPDEEEAVVEALELLDDLESHRNDPLRLFMRDTQRYRLLGAAEEVELAKAMEAGVDQALDAVAQWPEAIARLLVASASIDAGDRPLDWMSHGMRDDALADIEKGLNESATPADETRDNLGDDEADEDIESVVGAVAPDDERRSFLGRVAGLRALVGDGGIPKGIPAVRAALASLRLKASFLMALGDAAAGDKSVPSKRFSDGIRVHRSARDRFAVANIRLVLSIARRYMGSGLPLDDLIQEGNIGLLKAVDRFDWRRGFKFSTMATWWVRQQISRSVADAAHIIRLPVHAHEAAQAIRREAKALEAAHGSWPTFQVLADRMSIPPEKIEAFIRSTTVPISIDDLDDEPCLHDPSVGDPFETVAAEHLRRALNRLLASLGHKPEQILRLRFGFGVSDGLTLEEVGVRFEVTRERIRQIEAKAMKRLQHPARQAVLRPWLYDEPPDQAEQTGDAEVSGNDDSDSESGPGAVERGQASRPAARQPSRETNHPNAGKSRSHSGDSKRSALDRLLALAAELGVTVDDDRAESGAVWVNLTAMRDNRDRRLVRKLLAMGFEYWPGRGYWR